MAILLLLVMAGGFYIKLAKTSNESEGEHCRYETKVCYETLSK